MPSTYIDLNSDLGEQFGIYQLGRDDAILELVTSANIACGFHAGDPSVMRSTVKKALQQGAAIGAHPGLPDLAGFGRRNMAVSPQEVYDMVLYQIGALAAFVQSEGGKLQHVKPHGALYNMAAANKKLAAAIAEATARFDSSLVLYGLAGSALIEAGQQFGLRTASEAFADRTYQEDGSLTPRHLPDALIHQPEQAAAQVVRMIKEGKVRTVQGSDWTLQADTICIHGDGDQALAFSRHIREALITSGIELRAIGRTDSI
ncbi:LamB/YcsF family protein [Paenibacillus senegalensis]|uniref:LamB/YcsF family protein n=1 Tax=Paenibacillus senegalensis TaxID=1465766 RepID=UPI000288E0B2|nr:5-oxoprolinase subunit PxpA [Paenibacillus senegalensis]